MGVQTVFPTYDVLFLASSSGVTIGVLKHTTLVGRVSPVTPGLACPDEIGEDPDLSVRET